MKHKKYKVDISKWYIEPLEEAVKNFFIMSKNIKGEFDLSDKKFEEAFEALLVAMKNELSKTLEYALQDDSTYIFFPVEWSEHGSDGIGNKQVDDPLTIYLRVGLDSGDDSPTYEFNLRKPITETLEMCAEDGSFSSGLRRLSESLRGLADEIDAVLAKTNAELTGRGTEGT